MRGFEKWSLPSVGLDEDPRHSLAQLFASLQDLERSYDSLRIAAQQGLGGAAIGARVERTSSQSIPNLSATDILWQSATGGARFDTHGLWSDTPIAQLLTVPEDGIYVASAGAHFADAGSAHSMRLVISSTDNHGTQGLRRVTAADVRLSASSILQLKAGDWLRAYVEQDSGGFLNLLATSDTFFALARVG